jgi:hypothetical protein
MEKGEVERIPAERVARAIVLVRGQRVLLDRDLAVLYGVETRVLNQAVRRNIVRFPPDFLFMLTREEIRDKSQIVTCSSIKHARSVSAFTEQGVAMLSSVLHSERAVQVNIEIMRAFVRLREMPVSIIHPNHRWSCSQSAIRNPQSEIASLPTHGPSGEIPAVHRIPGRGGTAGLPEARKQIIKA